MTEQPERDPDIQRAIDIAARELARRLEPWVVGMVDIRGWAAAFIGDLYAEGWRPVPRPEPVTTLGPRNPETAQRGAAAAREAIAQARKETQ